MIGFALCAPLGPIGILCARRALIYGKLYGIVSIIGASVTDAFYCGVAAFGLGSLSELLANYKMEVRLLASIVLVIVGLGIFLMKMTERDKYIKKGLIRAFFSTIFLTLSNPIPILVFASAFAATGILSFDGGKLHTVVIIIGVFAGSAIWSIIFGTFFTLFKPQFELRRLVVVNRVAGFAIGSIGILGIFVYVRHFFFH